MKGMITEKDSISAIHDILKMMNPWKTQKYLYNLLEMRPELSENILANAYIPLKVSICPKTKKAYIICDDNRYKDSYRSPWTGEYHPNDPDGPYLPTELRKLEIKANHLFEEYVKMYYDMAIPSVYVTETCFGFLMGIFIHAYRNDGYWDSVHHVDVRIYNGIHHYRLVSSLSVDLSTNGVDCRPKISLSGGLTMDIEKKVTTSIDRGRLHMEVIGPMVEDIENRLIQQMHYRVSVKMGHLLGYIRRA